MGIVRKTAPVQSGTVYGTLNQPEVFVEYTGVDTDTAITTVNNTSKTISVTATTYVVEVSTSGGEMAAEDFARLAQSTSAKVAVIGTGINVLCSAAENRADTDTIYKYYGPADASGYGYVVKVNKTPTAGATTYTYTVDEELIALMKTTFETKITVGGVQAGTTITKGTDVAELLQTILEGETPTYDWMFYRQTFETKPEIIQIDDTWAETDIPETVRTTGYTFSPLKPTGVNKGFISFAFTKEIGELTHIYQNGITILDLLNLFDKTECIYNDITYYVYTDKDKGIIRSDDTFTIKWTTTGEN